MVGFCLSEVLSAHRAGEARVVHMLARDLSNFISEATCAGQLLR